MLPDTWVRLPANPLALRPIARRLLQELATASADGALSSEVLDLGRQRGVVIVRDAPLDGAGPGRRDLAMRPRLTVRDGHPTWLDTDRPLTHAVCVLSILSILVVP